MGGRVDLGKAGGGNAYGHDVVKQFASNGEPIRGDRRINVGFTPLNGNAKRGNGVLDNEMYLDRMVWNRQRFIKDPDTGKRRARPNPGVGDSGRRTLEDGEARPAATKIRRGDDGREAEYQFRDRR